MKISLTTDSLKHVYKVCSPHVSKDDHRPALKYIQLLVENGHCTATALNGASLAQTMISVNGDDGEYLIPVVKVPKRAWCTIENLENEIIIDFISSKHVSPMPDSKFIEWERMIPNRKPSYEIGFSPAVMTTAMASFKGHDAVTLSFGNPLEGMFVKSTDAFVMALPTHLKNQK